MVRCDGRCSFFKYGCLGTVNYCQGAYMAVANGTTSETYYIITWCMYIAFMHESLPVDINF